MSDDKQCVYCGAQGHRSHQCPWKQPLRERLAGIGCLAVVFAVLPAGPTDWQFWVVILAMVGHGLVSFMDGVRKGVGKASKHFVDSVDEYVRRHPQ